MKHKKVGSKLWDHLAPNRMMGLGGDSITRDKFDDLLHEYESYSLDKKIDFLVAFTDGMDWSLDKYDVVTVCMFDGSEMTFSSLDTAFNFCFMFIEKKFKQQLADQLWWSNEESDIEYIKSLLDMAGIESYYDRELFPTCPKDPDNGDPIVFSNRLW